MDKLVSVASDGAPAMMTTKLCLRKLIPAFHFPPVHCCIHSGRLVARYFKYEDVMKSVLQIDNFMHINVKTH